MWKGCGRSGYGDQAILGDYDDWDGLSMNGRRWKNRETKETRDLSGSDYWHQRKAIEPKMHEDVPTFVNGRPNISAFSEPEPVRKVKPKKSVADKIDLAQRHFDRLEQLSIDLDQEYFDGEIDQTHYDLLRYKLDERLIKAWNRLEKDSLKAWQKEDREFEENSLVFSLDDVKLDTAAKCKEKSFKALAKTADKSAITGQDWLSLALKDCKDSNVFLIGYCTIMNIVNKLKEALKCNS